MQITIAKLWPASPKYVSFKGVDGRSYKGEPSLNGKLFEGMTIEATCKESTYTGQDGSPKTTWWLPKTFEPDNTVGAIIPQPNGQHAPTSTYPVAQTSRPAGMVDRDVSITQQTLLKAFIGTGQFVLTDLPMLEEACTASAKRLVKAAS